MTHIPLHHGIYSPAQLPALRKQQKEKATLAFTMFAYAGMAAAKRMLKLADGVVPGFRASFVNSRLADADMTGRVGGVPTRQERRNARLQIKHHWKMVRKNEAEERRRAVK